MQPAMLETYRAFLKDTIRTRVDFSQTDQAQGVPPPPIEKPADPALQRIPLPLPDQWAAIGQVDLLAAMTRRTSHRNFRPTPVTLEELAFLLWVTQGIKRQVNAAAAFRTVPSAGCRHAFETYLWAMRVTGLAPGCYRYLPVEHQLVFEFAEEQMAESITRATLAQGFTGRAAVTFIWTAIPYRMEWRYGMAAHKVIALDVGHVCQNLYLACEAIGAGTCAIAAYDQEQMDRLLRLDGREEFTIYLAPVGKIA